jgi:amino acid adenylation domain-containing protein
MLHEIFEARALAEPDRVALVGAADRLTYGELAARSNQVAHALQRLGVGPESLVALCVDRSVELVIGIIGILKAGGAYVPIDPANPPARNAMLLADCAPSVVVSVARVAGSLPVPRARLLCIDRDAAELMTAPRSSVQHGAVAANLAYVIYTSGSTGLPKGVLVEHRNVVRLFDATREWFDFNDRDVWTLAHSFAFDFSVWEIFGALLHGGQLVIVPAEVTRSPQQFRALLAERRVTVLNQTPSAFRSLVAEERSHPADLHLRHVVFGGESLDVRMLESWIERYGDERPRLVNMYGITETTVHATYRRITADDLGQATPSPIGVPLRGLTIDLLDESGNASPVGATGEIYVSGAGVARGYLNRPELTAERFIVPPGSTVRHYRSGDRAVRSPDGELRYLGRVDEQVKVRGFRVEPREIESVLAGDPRVMTAVVVARDYGNGDIRLVASVVPKSPLDLEAAAAAALVRDLSASAKAELPPHMCPSAVHVLATLPITPNGKVDRKTLARPPAGWQNAPGPNDAAGAIVAALVAIWGEILELAEVGCSDDFFDLGGTSLAVIRMLGRVNEQFAVALDPSALLEEATIDCLARLIEEKQHVRVEMETTDVR